jgi:hypothetical protein
MKNRKKAMSDASLHVDHRAVFFLKNKISVLPQLVLKKCLKDSASHELIFYEDA